VTIAQCSRGAMMQRLYMRGFSIVELMVAMALSVMLLAGVVAIFASSRSSYETTEKMSRIQENGRFALDQIVRDIRAAGYVGCARAPTYLSTSLNNTGNLPWNFLDSVVRGYQSTGAGTWAPMIDTTVVPNAANGSDVLVLRIPKPDAQPLRVLADMTSGTDPITVPNTTASGLEVGDIAVAYSCEARSYFYVTGFAGGQIDHGAALPGTGNQVNNALATINYAFRRNAEVIPVQTIVYYIRRSTAAAAGIGPADATSLWRRTSMGTPEELVEGVEQMQLKFGVDTTNDSIVDTYVDANAVANWENVYSVSVALLQRSLEEYGPDTDQEQHQLLDVNVPAVGDRRLREVFTTTASIRNRVPVN
jgi:type IV pilus assembly protein PilW